MKELQKKKPTLAQALTPIIFMVVALALGYGVFKIKAEPIIICSAFIAGIILGVGRAVGETMAVIMVAGNQAVMPRGLAKGIRTLTANIVLEMGYAAGLHREALIATSVVLFFFILIINFVFMMTKKKA